MAERKQAPAVSRLTPWFYGWNVLAVAVLVQAYLLGATHFTVTFWVTPWAQEFGASRSAIMWSVMGAYILSSLLAPVAGRALDRWSIRALLAAGAASLGAGAALAAHATALWQIAGIYAVFISTAMCLGGPIATQALAARWFRARRGLAIGIASGGFAIGGFAVPPVVTYVLAHSDWRQAQLMLAAVAVLLLVPLVLAVIRNDPADAGVEPEPEAPGGAPVHAAGGEYLTTAAILQRWDFWLTVIAFLPAMVVVTAIQLNLGPYAQDLGIGTQTTAFIVSVMSATSIAGSLIGGALTDRMPVRSLYYVTMATLAVAVALMIGHPGALLLGAAFALVGLVIGAAGPLLAAIVVRGFGPASFGQAIGLVYMFYVFNAIGGPLAAAVRDHMGSYDAFMAGGIAVIVGCAMVMLRAPRPASVPASAPT
ncbi:MAG: MFS transporter [Gammaproteobacteria bacterium]